MSASVNPKPAALGKIARSPSLRPAYHFRGGQIVASRYRLDAPIGKGTTSEVWSAWDQRRERALALKIVSLETRTVDDPWQRFEREARIYQKLQGPGFLPVHDFGFLGTHGFIAMDLLDGETLEDRLRRRRKLGVAEVDAILDAVGQALATAHGHGIVHRDLKPANIFLPHDDTKFAAMLLDFGIAHVDDGPQRLTKPGVMLGSAAYMSPEQIKNCRAIDARSDLWALGVILYRALSGARPFLGEKAEVLVSILNDPPIAFQHQSGSPNLVPFFQRALQKDPAARFQSVPELVAAFRAAAGAERGASDRPTFVDLAAPAAPPVEQRPTLRVPAKSARPRGLTPRPTKPSLFAQRTTGVPSARAPIVVPVMGSGISGAMPAVGARAASSVGPIVGVGAKSGAPAESPARSVASAAVPSVMPHPSTPAPEPLGAGDAWDLLAQPADVGALLSLMGAPERPLADTRPPSRSPTRPRRMKVDAARSEDEAASVDSAHDEAAHDEAARAVDAPSARARSANEPSAEEPRAPAPVFSKIPAANDSAMIPVPTAADLKTARIVWLAIGFGAACFIALVMLLALR